MELTSLGLMLFLSAIDLLIANEGSLGKPISELVDTKAPLEEVVPLSKPENIEEVSDQFLPYEEILEIKPFVLEGSVENFDPVLRAIELSKTIPRQFCGTYKTFDEGSDVNVKMTITELRPIGQIIYLYGEMYFDDLQTPIHGNLNAKSDQLELIPIAENLIAGIEPGGSFVGLQGTKIFSWKSPRLDNPGGRLELKEECNEKISKASILYRLW